MAKLIRKAFGRFISCVDKHTGKEYSDWRAAYYGCKGVIELRESERKYPGLQFVYFYPSVEGPSQPYFNTPCAEYKEQDENRFTLTSLNSVWTFEFGEFDMTDVEKQEMLLNMMDGVF